MQKLSLPQKMVWLSQRGSDRHVWSAGIGLLLPCDQTVSVLVGDNPQGQQLSCEGEWHIEHNGKPCAVLSMLNNARSRGVSMSELLAYWHDYDHPYLVDYRIISTPTFCWESKGNEKRVLTSVSGGEFLGFRQQA